MSHLFHQYLPLHFWSVHYDLSSATCSYMCMYIFAPQAHGAEYNLAAVDTHADRPFPPERGVVTKAIGVFNTYRYVSVLCKHVCYPDIYVQTASVCSMHVCVCSRWRGAISARSHVLPLPIMVTHSLPEDQYHLAGWQLNGLCCHFTASSLGGAQVCA